MEYTPRGLELPLQENRYVVDLAVKLNPAALHCLALHLSRRPPLYRVIRNPSWALVTLTSLKVNAHERLTMTP